ncbi:hypothetical protein ACS0TY_005233 [Phlomoides rotata]
MANAKKDSTAKNNNNSSSISSLHPPYLQMIREAITTMKDRTGSSQPAIAKFMEENYTNQLPPNFKKNLSIQLKRLVKSEKVIKVKNSYKISAAEKEIQKKKPETTEITYSETEKKKKTKRLSLIKTPEALKKAAARVSSTDGEKVKNRAATPAKRKAVPKLGAQRPAKKAKTAAAAAIVDGEKGKMKAATPAKRKVGPKIDAKPPAKKAKK